MKKYISFSILLCICIGVVGLLLWQFRDFVGGDGTGTDPEGTEDVAAVATGDTTPVVTTPADTTAPVVTTPPPVVTPAIALDMAGTCYSRHITSLTLRMEWAIYRGTDNADVYLSAELYLDGDALTLPAGRSGYVTVAGQTASFAAPAIQLGEGGSVRLGTVTFHLPEEEREDVELPVFVRFEVNAAHGGISYQTLELKGSVHVTDAYGAMEDQVELALPAVDATSLPSGTAVLSLTSLLNYYGLEADAVAISDTYLDKMPAGFTSPEEANVGNPKNKFNSYECHAPVLAECSQRYLRARGSALTAEDRTGCNLSALLLCLSEGDPLVVWMPADPEAGPVLAHTWSVEGKTVHMNAIRCAILSGYDLINGTVTLVYPGEEPALMDMSLFWELFARMGAQCIVLR